MTGASPEQPDRRATDLSNFFRVSLYDSLKQRLTVKGMDRVMGFHNRMCAFGRAMSNPEISREQAALTLEAFALVQFNADQMSQTLFAQSETITAMAAKIDWLESENRELRERVEATDLQAQIDGLKESLYSLRAFAVNTSDFVTGAQSNKVDRLQLELDNLKERMTSGD